MTEKIIQFPEGQDWFVWRDDKGELHRFYKGRYAIIRTSTGYIVEYISPDLGKWEDAVLEFGDLEKEGKFEIIDKCEVNSRIDYEKLLERVEELNNK